MLVVREDRRGYLGFLSRVSKSPSSSSKVELSSVAPVGLAAG